MSQGRDLKLYISSDGTNAGSETEVELQGDLTINPGRSNNVTVYKNGQRASTNDAGFTASFSMGNTAPLATGETLVWDAHESASTTYAWIRNAVTGGIEWEFPAKFAISTFNATVNNPAEVQVSVAADGVYPTRGAAS